MARRRVLFLTSNGVGVGHVTRLMACARRLPPEVQPIFATLSLAVRAVIAQGHLCEYIPRHPSWKAPTFDPFLRERLIVLAHRYQARALVFDGTLPYGGLVAAKPDLDVPFVWMRRAMWQPGVNAEALERRDVFDVVIEPGEVAEEADAGLTVALRDQAVRVPPITFFDEHELLGRDDARRELGLDPERQIVLLMLGSFATGETQAAGPAILERVSRLPDTQVVIVGPAAGVREPPPGAVAIDAYPIGRYLRAFDAAFSGPGYNAFHELLRANVPTVFVTQTTRTDDGEARARHAESAGIGLALAPFSEERLEACVEAIASPELRSRQRERMAALATPNGAADAARVVVEQVGVG